MESNKVNVTIRIANAAEFRSLVEKFNQKARELNEVAQELELFRFEGEIESKVIPKEKIYRRNDRFEQSGYSSF